MADTPPRVGASRCLRTGRAAADRGGGVSETACTPGSVPRIPEGVRRRSSILGRRLPGGSCGRPESSGGAPVEIAQGDLVTLGIRAHTTLSSRQMEFLKLLKDFIIERERVEKKDLISAPFTVIHPQGIRGVFSPAEINEILQLTERLAA